MTLVDQCFKGLKKPGQNNERKLTTHQTQLMVATVTRHAGEHGESRQRPKKEKPLTATTITANIATATNTGQFTYDALSRKKKGRGFCWLLGNRSHSDHVSVILRVDGTVFGVTC